MGRRQFIAEFKMKIVLEILREEKPTGAIVAEHGISPNQFCDRIWSDRCDDIEFIPLGVFVSKTTIDRTDIVI